MSLSDDKKNRMRKRIKIFSAIFKLCLLLIILIGLPLYIYFFHQDLIARFSSMESIETFFDEHKTQSVFIYIGAQILQIVICIIPGQWLQFAAGYMFGLGTGFLFSLAGACIGTVLTYYIAKVLGHDAMHLIFGEEKIHHMLSSLNSKKAVILVFLIFLIPGVPKDLCNYVAGLSEMKLKPFLVISLIGRTPGMLGSLIIGHQIYKGGYVSAAVIAVIAVVLCVLGIIYRKKLTGFVDKCYEKLMKM